MSSRPAFCVKKTRRLARLLTCRAVLGLAVFVAIGAGSAVLAAVLVWLVFRGDAALWQDVAFLIAAVAAGSVTLRAARWLAVVGPPAAGVRLPRDEAPELHQLVDELAARMGAMPVDAVHITTEMNASVHQRPRWGVFGPMQTTLVLGLPLVLSIAPTQLTAIVAHEIGHLARQRRGLQGWAAYSRAWWHRACDRLAEDATLPARVLYGCLAGWSDADVRAAVRLNHLEEYEADSLGARVVGARVLGDTLLEVAMKANYIAQDYWDTIMAQADKRPQPGMLPFRDMGHGVAIGFQGSPHASSLGCLDDDAGGVSLHPSLSDRLAALSVDPSVPAGTPVHHYSAATHFLQSSLDRLCARFDQLWWAHIAPSWRRHYARRAHEADAETVFAD